MTTTYSVLSDPKSRAEYESYYMIGKEESGQHFPVKTSTNAKTFPSKPNAEDKICAGENWRSKNCHLPRSDNVFGEKNVMKENKWPLCGAHP